MHGSCAKCESGRCCAISRKGVKFGLAFAVPNAVFMVALGWAGWLFNYGRTLIEQSSAIYHGFGPTFGGGIAGGLWGFFIGFIYGYIFGLVLQCYSSCCGKCSPSSCSAPNDPKK
jgi:hypothetical protein